VASGQMSEPTWGDEVAVGANAPVQFRPGSKAWVVGIRKREGDTLLLIEFEDGTSIEVPGDVIEAAQP
jgi:hypothetical protein